MPCLGKGSKKLRQFMTVVGQVSHAPRVLRGVSPDDAGAERCE